MPIKTNVISLSWNATLSVCTACTACTQPFWPLYRSIQPALPNKNWRILSKLSFKTCMPFLMTEAHRIRDKILEYCSMVLPAPSTYLQSSIYSTKYQHNHHHHFPTIIQVNQKALSALTLLVERQEGHLACKKKWVVGCWCGYLSGARCKFAYGPADATATHCLSLQ